MPLPTLSAAIVAYRPDERLLERAVASLAVAVRHAQASGALGPAVLYLVDNGEGERAIAKARAAWPAEAGRVEVLAGHGNVGYGRANNLALARARSDFHLVMNPDVEVERDAIRAGIAALQAHPDVGLAAPRVEGAAGEPPHLCKRYPSVWVLFLRGFAPRFLRERHRDAIARYEMREALGDTLAKGVPLASGCFMLARTPLLARLGGFDPGYFMYFEDYDLSLRLGREAAVAYVPAMRIHHHGGDAARKGARHVAWFASSAWRFFSRHGWRWR